MTPARASAGLCLEPRTGGGGRTVTVQVSVFPLTLALTTAFPAFFAVIFPVAVTTITARLVEVHFALYLLPVTFSWRVFPL